MKPVNWESVLGQIDDIYIQDAFSTYHRYASPHPSAKEKEMLIMKKKKHVIRPLSAIAAAVVLICTLGISAYATGMFGILDRKVELHTDLDPSESSSESTSTLVNINGYQGSNEYNIAVEWNEYLKQCAENGTNQPSPEMVEDEYLSYGAFSQEAKDMLDSLLEKYNLRMFTESVNVAGQTELYNAVGVTDFLPTSAGLEDMIPFGTVYNHFSMEFMDSANLPNGKNVPYDLFCFEKGVFLNRGFLNADAESFEEWVYTAKDGTAVTLDLSNVKSVMMAELENCNILVNIRSGSANNDPSRSSYNRDPLTKEDLEAFAELFDFEKMGSIGSQP